MDSWWQHRQPEGAAARMQTCTQELNKGVQILGSSNASKRCSTDTHATHRTQNARQNANAYRMRTQTECTEHRMHAHTQCTRTQNARTNRMHTHTECARTQNAHAHAQMHTHTECARTRTNARANARATHRTAASHDRL